MSQPSFDRPEKRNDPDRRADSARSDFERTVERSDVEPRTDGILPEQTIQLASLHDRSVDRGSDGSSPPDTPITDLQSLMSSQQVDRTVSSAGFLNPDVEFWGDATRQSASELNNLPPAVERSLSETKLNLRNREIAPEQSPPELAATADYRLVRMIGKGGMGNVYAARQGSLDRLVAIKVIKPLEGSKRTKHEQNGELEKVEKQRRLQFISEAVVTADLEHPNIVPIHDIAIAADKTLFYAMRRVSGTPWSKMIAEKSRDENLEVLLKVCDAVGFAHTRGVVHRDIKPENVMLSEFGVVTVMDWGLALAKPSFEKHEAVFQTTGLGGSPAYMAPEMATGPVQRIGPASDIYLLGATLYQIITGFAPHHGENVRDCLRAVAANKIREVPAHQQGELLDIAMSAMATEPEDRFADVRSFQDAIREYRSHSESIALTSKANKDLRQGQETRNYAHFARALLCFEEAVELWDGNRRAAKGLEKAKLAYAEAALRKGDIDLGLSLLDASNSDHQELIEKLNQRRRERRSRKTRLIWLYRSVAAMLVFILIGGAFAMYQINRSATEAKIAQGKAERSAQDAMHQAEEASRATDEATAQAAQAKTQESIAMTEAENARLARRKSEYESYISRIGLVKARVDQNEFDDARRILGRLKQERGEQRLGWEWRWLSKQTHQSHSALEIPAGVIDLAVSRSSNRIIWLLENGSVYTSILDSSGQWQMEEQSDRGKQTTATAIAVSDQTGHVAVATAHGSIEIWNPLVNQRIHVFAAGNGKISALSYAPGELVVSAATDRTARLWDPATGTELAVCRHRGPVVDLAVAARGGSTDRLVVVTAIAESMSGYAACWELVRPAAGGAQSAAWSKTELGNFRGHRGAVLSVALSPDGELAASGDALGECLIWHPAEVEPADDRSSVAASAGQVSGRQVSDVNGEVNELKQPFVRLTDRSQRSIVADASSTVARSPSLAAHRDAIHSLAFAPQGDSLASGGDDYTLKLWDVERGDVIETFRGHGGWVRRVDFAEGADRPRPLLISGSSDATIRSWDPLRNVSESVEILAEDAGARLSPHQDAISAVRFDTTGSLIVSASRDQTARVLRLDDDRHTFSPVAVLREDQQERSAREGTSLVALSAVLDRLSSRLFVASGDAVVRVWDVRDAVELGRLDATGLNHTLAVSPEGRFLLTRSSDPEVACILWEFPPGSGFSPRIVREFRGHPQPVTALAISPDGRVVFTADRGGLGILWDVADQQAEGRRLDRNQGFSINAAAFSQDGSELWIAADDHQLTRVQVASGEIVSQSAHQGPVTQLSLSGDDRFAVTLSEQPLTDRWITQATLWDTATGEQRVIDRRERFLEDRSPAEHTQSSGLQLGSIVSASFGSTPSRVILAVQGPPNQPNRVAVWDIASDGVTTRFDLPDSLAAITAAIPIATDSMVTLNGEAAILWDVASQSQVKSYRTSGMLTQAGFSSDSQFVATVGASVTLWELATGGLAAHLASPHEGPVHAAQFSPAAGSSKLATAGQDGVIRWWDWDPAAKEIKLVRHWELSGPRRPIRCVTISPDEQWLVAVGDQGVVRMLSTDDQGVALTYDLAEAVGLTSAAFNADGSWIAVGGTDSEVRLWPRVAPGEAIPEPILLQGHADRIEDVRFLEDGTQEIRVLTASRDRSARVWDPQIGSDELIGREILALRRHRLGVTGIDVSADGRTVITAGADAQLVLWPADPRPNEEINGR